MGFSDGDPPSGLHSGVAGIFSTPPSTQRDTSSAAQNSPPSTSTTDSPNQRYAPAQTFPDPNSPPNSGPLPFPNAPSPSLSLLAPTLPPFLPLFSTNSGSSTSAASVNASLSTPASGPTSQTHFGASPPRSTSTVKFRGPSITSTNAATSTASSSSSVKDVSLGTVVGTIVGGLFGLLALFIICSSIRRRWNRHNTERDFIPEGPPPTNWPNAHVTQAARHISTRSVTDGAGVSGRGVIASRAAAMAEFGAYNRGYAGYPVNEVESDAGGYRPRPQNQAPYNPEAYSPYIPPHSGTDYQQAAGIYQYQHWSEALAHMGYTISEPSTPQAVSPVLTGSPRSPVPSSRPKTTTAAALGAAYAAAATHVPPPATAERRNSASYTHEDAYGGI